MKSTKKALLLSITSMILCVAMLMGTTFAWFTDTVTSGTNKIVAGNLDIELEYSKDGTTWATVQDKTDLFGNTLWEPGATSVVYLKLTNKGTLALKYNLTITATGGNFTNVAGEAKNLKNALKFAQVAGSSLTTYATRDDAVAATASTAIGLSDYAQANHMAANDVSYITLVVTMPTTVDNEFNYKTGTTAPSLDLGIKLEATQYTAEKDSFDQYYDVMSEPVDVYTVDEFNAAVAQAKTGAIINVKTADLELTVAYTDTKTITLKGEKIAKLTANIPNATIHVYNKVTTVVGTNVDLQNSAHFYSNIGTLNATAGHFVIEEGAKVDEIVSTPVLTTAEETVKATAKELKIEVKGEATTVTTPAGEPEKDVEIKVSGTVEKVEVPKADTKIAVKVEENATVETVNITDNSEEAKIVLQNEGTIGNEADVTEKTQEFAEIDKNAKTLTISNADELRTFAKGVNAEKYNGYTATLGADIDLENVEWTQINGAGKSITFDGNNKTIKNLKISDGHDAGFFKTGTGCKIKNLTIDGATVTGIGRIAVICGHGLCVTVDNCTVKNATVTAAVTNNDDGDKAGAIVGYLSAEPNASVTNCKVENVTVKGYRDIGALVGYAGGTYTIKDNTLANIEVICDKSNNYKNYTTDAEYDVNFIVGEQGDAGTYANTGIIAGTYDVDPTQALATGYIAKQEDDKYSVSKCDHTVIPANYSISAIKHSYVCACGENIAKDHTFTEGVCVCGYKSDAKLLEENPNYTCRIGNTGYVRPFGENTAAGKASSALKDAKSGDTIKMIADYTSTNDYYANQKVNDCVITIDLNSKKINMKTTFQPAQGIYNIIDTSEDKTGSVNKIALYNYQQDSFNTTLNVYAGKIDKISTAVPGSYNVNIHGGTITLIELQDMAKGVNCTIDGGSVSYISVYNDMTVGNVTTLSSCAIGDEITGQAKIEMYGSEFMANAYRVYTVNAQD